MHNALKKFKTATNPTQTPGSGLVCYYLLTLFIVALRDDTIIVRLSATQK